MQVYGDEGFSQVWFNVSENGDAHDPEGPQRAMVSSRLPDGRARQILSQLLLHFHGQLHERLCFGSSDDAGSEDRQVKKFYHCVMEIITNMFFHSLSNYLR